MSNSEDNTASTATAEGYDDSVWTQDDSAEGWFGDSNAVVDNVMNAAILGVDPGSLEQGFTGEYSAEAMSGDATTPDGPQVIFPSSPPPSNLTILSPQESQIIFGKGPEILPPPDFPAPDVYTNPRDIPPQQSQSSAGPPPRNLISLISLIAPPATKPSDTPEAAGQGKPADAAASKIDPKATAVLQHWQQTKAQAGNAIASAQADVERSKFYDNVQSQIAAMPPDQRAPFVASQLPDLRKAIAGFTMTPDRARQEAARQSQWEAQALNNISTQGTKEYFQKGRDIGLADVGAKIQGSDVEGAHARLADLRASHLISDQEYQDQVKQMAETLKEKNISSFMNQAPKMFNQDINEHAQTGSHPILGSLIEGPENIAMWKARSDTQYGKIKTGEQQSLFTGIHGGTTTRPDQIHSAVAGSQTLDEKDREAALRGLANASAPLDPAKYNNLRVAVAHYDAKADPGSAQQASLQRAIAASLPSGEGGIPHPTLHP